MDNEIKYNDLFGKAIPQLIHDIRNPLNIVIGFSSMLQIDDSINEEVRTYIQKIFQSGMAIEQLLTNIDFFAMEKQDLQANDIEISKEIDNFFKSKYEVLSDKKITVHLSNDNKIFTFFSGELLTKILDNLFQFSMKGFKSTKNKEIFLSVDLKNSNLEIIYSDSSENATIEGKYFTFDETLKHKRGLGPIFIEKYVSLVDGTADYLYLKNWSEIPYASEIKTSHGFVITIPIAVKNNDNL